jgi:hypothetical protein
MFVVVVTQSISIGRRSLLSGNFVRGKETATGAPRATHSVLVTGFMEIRLLRQDESSKYEIRDERGSIAEITKSPCAFGRDGGPPRAVHERRDA